MSQIVFGRPNVPKLSRGGREADDVGCSAMLGGAHIFTAGENCRRARGPTPVITPST
jgi:hypothetical protein